MRVIIAVMTMYDSSGAESAVEDDGAAGDDGAVS